MYETIEIPHSHELVSFEVELQDIRLNFGTITVEIASALEISEPGGKDFAEAVESVWYRKGNLNALWPLIGKRMEKIVMDEDYFRIAFEDGTIIRRKFEPRPEVVNFWGPGPDNFTSYPNVLDDSPVTPEMKQAILNAVIRKLPED